MKNDLRPISHMKVVSIMYPGAWQAAETFRSSRGIDVPDWPEWCFLPHGAWHAYVGAINGDVNFKNKALIKDISLLAAIAPWCCTQGIYRFDKDLVSSLDLKYFKNCLPVETLLRLPEWSVYIETPNRSWLNNKLYGFWASLEADANSGGIELRFLFDTGDDLQPHVIHLGPWSLAEGIVRAFRFSYSNCNDHPLLETLFGLPDNQFSLAMEELANAYSPLVAMVLHLCSDEYLKSRNLYETDIRPQAQLAKNGFRLFPADKPTIWEVGKASSKASYKDNTVDPQQIIIASFADMPRALVKGKSYHSELPDEIKDWYCYTIDGGHSILVIAKDDVEVAFSEKMPPYMFSVPAPVKLVLRLGYENHKGYVITDAKYSNFGLEFEDDDEEF